MTKWEQEGISGDEGNVLFTDCAGIYTHLYKFI